MICPRCQTENPDTANFCRNCGLALVHKCSNCQTELPQGARFCMDCGQPVLVETPTDADRLSRLTAVVPRSLEQKIRSASREGANYRRGSLGEHRTVTTLLVDVVGSTALANELDLETWMEMMNHAFDRIVPVIYRYEGTIARMLGDSLLAFFGAPVAHEDDPQRAVKAGLEIISQIKAYSQEVKDIHGVEFAMRVCINTGPVEIGPVGDDLTYDFTAFGGTVNLTSRIKFAGTPMSVLVTGNTNHFIAPYFDSQDLGSIEVKGMNEVVRVYQVKAARSTLDRTRGFAELESPLVGRKNELATLLHVCEAVRAGMGRAVVIIGEPGLGKTRLIQEWHKAAEATIATESRSADKLSMGLWVTGRCESYGQGLAYQLLIDLLRNLIGVTVGSDEPETHKALFAMTRDLFGDQAMEVYPYLGHLLSLRLEGEALLRAQISDPQALRTQYLQAVQRLFQACMKENPLVLVLEDLHWADASSTELFIKLLPLVARSPILFCLVTRPNHDASGWKLVTAAREMMGSSLTEISLNALTEKESRTLVANLLEIETLPKHVRELILSKAEGNPYFVEEVVRMFIDRGVIFHQDGTWVAQGEIDEHDIPDNLQGLLLARIDRLPVEARHTLLMASVIGRNFPVKILSHINKGTRTLFNDLGTLESSGLIQMAKVEPELLYMFRHSLVQDASYALLLERDRRLIHQAVGDAFESLYPERKRELAAILAYHFKESGQEERALSYFIIAGDVALAAYANHEAEIQYRRALELKCCSDAEIAWLFSGLGEALYLQSRLDESIQAYHSGIDIYKSLGDSNGIARLYSQIGRIAWLLGDAPEDLRICLEGLELVNAAPSSVGKATLMHETARAYFFLGMSDKALPLCRQALALAEELGAVQIQAETLVTLGIILPDIPTHKGVDALHRAVELAEANGWLYTASRAHNNLGSQLIYWQADYRTAMDHYYRSAELGKLRDSASEESFGLLNYVLCLFPLGRYQEIEAQLPHLDELVGRISNPTLMHGTIFFVKGSLKWLQGDWETAITIYRQCLQLARQRNYPETVLLVIVELSRALLEKNRWGELADLTEVETLLQEALQVVERTDLPGKIWVYPRMSILQARLGQPEQAHQWLEKSRQVGDKTPSAWDPVNQGQCEVEIALAEQDWMKALAAIERVSPEQQRLGLRVDWAISLMSWADIHIRSGEPANLERAQTLLGEALAAFIEMGVGHYPDIAEKLLQVTRTRVHAQTLDHEQMTRELKKARQVQESLLPENPPEVPGWGLAVVLEPAHETSGDFYDFLPLSNGSLGLVIADVTDKGTSAALFMALGRSLWRTFAINHQTEPELTMAETNRRILGDTHGGLFITMFYGILNPQNGNFIYCSAGHHPALLMRAKDGTVEELGRTGIPLGVFDEANWSSESVDIGVRDALVLYTDGITDAQNAAEEFFGLERLKGALIKQRGKPAKELHEALLAEVRDWVGEAPQFDDITLMVMVRE